MGKWSKRCVSCFCRRPEEEVLAPCSESMIAGANGQCRQEDGVNRSSSIAPATGVRAVPKVVSRGKRSTYVEQLSAKEKAGASIWEWLLLRNRRGNRKGQRCEENRRTFCKDCKEMESVGLKKRHKDDAGIRKDRSSHSVLRRTWGGAQPSFKDELWKRQVLRSGFSCKLANIRTGHILIKRKAKC